MDFYSLGQREALAKYAGFTDGALDMWEKLQPTKTPGWARAAGGLSGAAAGLGAGAGVGMYLGGIRHGSPGAAILATPETALGGLLGAKTGWSGGSKLIDSAHKAIVRNRRSAAISKYAPAAALGLGGLGATALVSSLLSRRNKEDR